MEPIDSSIQHAARRACAPLLKNSPGRHPGIVLEKWPGDRYLVMMTTAYNDLPIKYSPAEPYPFYYHVDRRFARNAFKPLRAFTPLLAHADASLEFALSLESRRINFHAHRPHLTPPRSPASPLLKPSPNSVSPYPDTSYLPRGPWLSSPLYNRLRTFARLGVIYVVPGELIRDYLQGGREWRVTDGSWAALWEMFRVTRGAVDGGLPGPALKAARERVREMLEWDEREEEGEERKGEKKVSE